MQVSDRRAAIYCRVSTGAQAENGTSLESQRDAFLKLAAEKGYAVSAEFVPLRTRPARTWNGPSWSLPGRPSVTDP